MRKRNINVSFRVDEQEKKAIDNMLKKSEFNSMSNYLRNLAMYGELVKVDLEPLNKCSYEVAKIGTNVNQIAKRVNRSGCIREEDVAQLKNDVKQTKMLVMGCIEELVKSFR